MPHVNGEGGSSTLCRFPVNTAPGGVIQYEPINPIRNTYDMSGTRITRFRVVLQDQHGDPVDTRSEEWNCTIVLEYEMPSALPTADTTERYKLLAARYFSELVPRQLKEGAPPQPQRQSRRRGGWNGRRRQRL